MSATRIGISGWTYRPWRGVFFPPKLPQRQELAYAASQVSSIEINGTFYALQRPASYAKWYAETPPGFAFSVKGPRYITHLRRLKECAAPLANFFASGVLRLEEKLGPILWQLPPSFAYDSLILEKFLALLPRDTAAAVKLAQRHDNKVKHVWIKTSRRRPLRHTLEIRHQSFCCPDFIRQLRRHRVGLVVADTAGKWPFLTDVTADFVYVRLHGDAALYVSGYSSRALQTWATRIRAWQRGGNAPGKKLATPAPTLRRGRDVFAYFDNDVKVHAPYDAMTLAHRLGLGAKASTRRPRPVDEIPRPQWPTLVTPRRDQAESLR